MKLLNIIGIDPGIRDTGLVSLYLDTDYKQFEIAHRVFSNVTYREKKTTVISPDYLEGIKGTVIDEALRRVLTHEQRVFVENFQQRGRNVFQDQDMLALVRETRKAVRGELIDNTSVKKIVTEDTLDAFKMRRFNVSTNHQDLKSAARILLMGMIKDDDLNVVVADFILDHIEGKPWSHVSTRTL